MGGGTAECRNRQRRGRLISIPPLASEALKSLQLSSDSEFIHADVLKAAVEEPLIEDDAGRVAFDINSFQHRILANAESRGRA